MKTIKLSLQISDMMCEGCVSNIKNALKELEGVENVDISLEHKSADLSYNPDKTKQDTIYKAIEEAGYSVDTAKQLAGS